MSNNDSIKHTVKGFIMDEFLAGENPDSVDDSTPLISGGILDSIATIKLVSFLEEKYKIEFAAHEMSVDYLDDLSKIAGIVQTKLEGEA